MRVEPIYRHRRQKTGTDAYGNDLYGWVKSQLEDGMFAPGGVQEPIEPGREPVVSEPTVYWRKTWPDVISSDLIEVRGVVYDVIGDPAEWRGVMAGGLAVKLKHSEDGVA